MPRSVYILLFFVCCSVSLLGGNPEKHKRTFAQKDPFHSAVFLQNNGIINDRNNVPIEYYANTENMHVYLTERGLIYRLAERDEKKIKERQKEKKKGGKAPNEKKK